MNRIVPIAAIALLLCLSQNTACAGGNYVLVKVVSLSVSKNVDFDLTVEPAPNNDAFMNKCKVFRLQGTYAFKDAKNDGASNEISKTLTSSIHQKALAALEQAKVSGQPINFGWMGGGFTPLNPERNCHYQSRALKIFQNGKISAVLSAIRN